jgi:DNA-directed RNA polymerase specialized sigma24 family protein
MQNRESVRVSREDDKSHWYEWEVVDPLDNPETSIIAEETRKELAKILGPAITKRIERVLKTLSPNEGFIVLARELLHMSNTELAACLYKTEGNVRKAYSKGKGHLGEEVN